MKNFFINLTDNDLKKNFSISRIIDYMKTNILKIFFSKNYLIKLKKLIKSFTFRKHCWGSAPSTWRCRCPRFGSRVRPPTGSGFEVARPTHKPNSSSTPTSTSRTISAFLYLQKKSRGNCSNQTNLHSSYRCFFKEQK